MIDELNKAIDAYKTKWDALVAERKDGAFFASLKITSLGWKTEDLAEFTKRADELRDLSDQIHYGWINERWLATFHLKGEPLASGIRVIKLMQRRPGSTDAVGLDHLDFYTADMQHAEQILQKEDVKWTHEMNGDRCKWLSVWFDGTEAKIRSDTVLEVCANEMLDVQKVILA